MMMPKFTPAYGIPAFRPFCLVPVLLFLGCATLSLVVGVGAFTVPFGPTWFAHTGLIGLFDSLSLGSKSPPLDGLPLCFSSRGV
jgi:hypothetical protein